MYKSHPRTKNVYVQDGKPLVAKVPHMNGEYLPHSVTTALDLLGGIEKSIKSGEQVMIKPNFNCEFALPMSTDLTFLSAIIEVLQDAGAKVSVGEMSGRAAGPTERVIKLLGVEKVLKRYGVPFVDFEKDEWIDVEVEGKHTQSIHVPRSIYEAEKRVYVANMRGHSSARFTSSLKLSVGWIDSDGRDWFHDQRELVGEKIPELNLAWQPDLVFTDGRRSTVTWHGRGEYVYPNVIMASGDMVAIDAEAVRVLKTFPEENRLDVPVEEFEQLRAAEALGLGSMDAAVVEAPRKTHTEQEGISPAEAAS